MRGRGKHSNPKQSPRNEKPARAEQLSPAEHLSPEEQASAAEQPGPRSVLPPLSAIVNTFLVGVVIAAGGLGARQFWPSMTTAVVIVGAGTVLAGGYLFFKSLYNDELKAYLRLMMTRRSTTAIVVVLLAAELTAGVLTVRARRQHVVRIVPGPMLRTELGFPGQTLRLVVDDTSFTVKDPKQTLFYIGGGTDHLQGALERERKANPRALETILRNYYRLDAEKPEDKRFTATILEQWQKSPLLVKRRSARTARRMPSATFLDPVTSPIPVALVLDRVPFDDDGVETYVAELPKQ